MSVLNIIPHRDIIPHRGSLNSPHIQIKSITIADQSFRDYALGDTRDQVGRIV